MAVNIKDPHVDRLLRELAEATGESLTTAARVAFEERLGRVRRRGSVDDRRRRMQAIVDELHRLPVLDDRSPDEIIGYDEYGLPS